MTSAFRRKHLLGIIPFLLASFTARAEADGGTIHTTTCGTDMTGALVMNPVASKVGVLYSQKRGMATGDAGYPISPDDFAVVRNLSKWVKDSVGSIVEAPANFPAFEWGVGATCPYLLVEAEATSEISNGRFLQDVDPTGPPANWGSVTITGTLAYSAGSNAYWNKIRMVTTVQRTALHHNFVFTPGNDYIMSVYINVISNTDARLDNIIISRGGAENNYLLDGVITPKNTVAPLGRHLLQFTIEQANVGGIDYLRVGNGVLGDCTADIEFEMFQLETGLVASSFIATTAPGGALTRPADVITVTVPAGVTEVIETVNEVVLAPKVVTPGTTYTIPAGRVSRIEMN